MFLQFNFVFVVLRQNQHDPIPIQSSVSTSFFSNTLLQNFCIETVGSVDNYIFYLQKLTITIIQMIIIFCFLFATGLCYYEIELFRNPGDSKNDQKWITYTCDNFEEQEPCYYKDIAYTLQLYYQHEIYSLSADLTAPKSWIKGKGCQIADSTKRCKLLKQSVIEEFSKNVHELGQSIISLKRQQIKKSRNDEIQTGSMQKIKGKFQKNKQLHFWTVDSNRYVSLIKILGVGFFIDGEKDQIKLSHTNYINASEVNHVLNGVCDGAVSLRFDTESQNSFLNQIFGAIDETERTVTVFIDQKSILTLGEVSTKRVVGGDQGVKWIDLSNKNYITISSIKVSEQDDSTPAQKVQLQTYLTLSASYISFPPNIIIQIIEGLPEYKCAKTLNGFIECFNINKKFYKKQIVVGIAQLKLSYQLQDLFYYKKHSSVVLKVRESDSNITVLGQPHFKQYFTILDYKKDRVGIGHKFIIPDETVVTSTTIIRFMVFCFFFGCLLLACSKPIKRAIAVLQQKLGSDLQKNKYFSQRGQYNQIPKELQQVEEI